MAKTIIDEIFDMTDSIMGEISSSVDRGDYSGLGDNIRRQMNGFGGTGRTTYAGDRGEYNINRVSYTSDRYDRQTQEARDRRAGVYRQMKAPFMRKKPGKGKGIGLMTLGIIGLLIFAPIAIGASSIAGTIFAGVLCGGAGYSLYKGIKNRKLTKTFYRYASLVGNAEYIDIKALARKTGESQEEVTKNLEKMIKEGMLPFAVFDDTKTSLILTDEAYRQYEDAVASSRSRKAEEQAEEEEDGSGTKESRRVIRDGEAFLAEVRRANDQIAEPEMSEKLFRLEEIVQKIIDQVRRDPSNAVALRKFMNYYVPTTQKLIKAYVDLNGQPEVGDNITRTKREIEDAIDAVNGASAVLLNDLFEDVAWDIASDISVMKSMMEQDGLAQQAAPAASPFGAAAQTAEAGAYAAQTAEAGAYAAQTAEAGEAEATAQMMEE